MLGPLIGVLMLSACAVSVTNTEKTATASPQAPAATKPAPLQSGLVALADPFPSTYKPLPAPPTLIKGAHLYDGRGGEIARGDVLMQDGKVVRIAESINDTPAGTRIIEANGRFVTPGVIDIHSHMGVYASPAVRATSDGNEATSPNTAEVWAEHSVWPQDPQFGRALAAGVTTVQVLPGSANLFGGRSVTLKVVPARTVQGMKFPGAPYGLKMACGENPKRVYGSRNQSPSTRMGNVAGYRAAWIAASEYRRKWDDYTARVAAGGDINKDRPVRDLKLETLADVLRGKILVQNHCYRADEMAQMIDISKEFGYKISTFHHAVESYKIADVLAKEGICSAMWADWWGFKLESYDAIRENIPFVHAANACAVIHSDSPYGVQRLNQEVAKALFYGRRAGIQISDATAWQWLSYNPAKAMGIAEKTGSLEPGKMADVVLWSADPFTVAARPEMVWVDGAQLYDRRNKAVQPVFDFEVGQPGSGDVK